jgi:transposase
MSRSYEYTGPEPWWPNKEPRVCPRCHQVIKVGERVHTWDGMIWHTLPCPEGDV